MKENKGNKKFNPVVYFVICLAVMLFADTYFTNIILHNIFINTDNFNFLDIVYVQNTGAAFSSFQHATLLLSILSIFAIIFILCELFRDIYKYTLPVYFSSAMLIAGVVCNTYERITLGYVRDYISFKFIEFPVFNISDVLINLGVIAILILIVTKKYKRHDK